MKKAVGIDFEQVVHDTQVRIRAYIAGMGIAQHEVDDLAQDVYIELYRCLDKIPAGVAIDRWLKGIARNVCLNHIRRISRRGRLHREALAEILARTKSELDPIVVDLSVHSALEGCCQRLPDRFRQILVLRYTEELASAAIARVMEMSAEAVRVTLHRIRTQLKKCIQSKLAQET